MESIFKAAGLKYPPRETDYLRWKDLRLIVSNLLQSVEVDEEWYKQTYPGVAQAVASGAFKSAKEHFVEHGYFEGRLPKKITVDEAFYRAAYPGVAKAIEEGLVHSAQEHFEQHGMNEGRLPFPIDRQSSRTSAAPADEVRGPSPTNYRRLVSSIGPAR
jgi:hypothetical protein